MATSIAAAAAASTTAQLRFLTDAAHLLRQTAPETSAFLMHRRTDVLATISASASASSNTATTASSSVSASAQAALAFTQTDAQRQRVCSSCGHILIPGSNGTTLTIQSGKAKKSAKRKRDSKDDSKSAKTDPKETREDVHTGITKVFACGSCSRETRIALPPPPPLPKNRRVKPHKAVAKEEPALEIQKQTLSTAPSTESKHNKAAPPPPAEAPKSTNANSKKRAKNRKAGLLALLDKNKGGDSSGFGGLGLSFDDFRKR